MCEQCNIPEERSVQRVKGVHDLKQVKRTTQTENYQ